MTSVVRKKKIWLTIIEPKIICNVLENHFIVAKLVSQTRKKSPGIKIREMKYNIQRAKFSMTPMILPLKSSSVSGKETNASDGKSFHE